MTAFDKLRPTYSVPFEMVTEHRSCDKSRRCCHSGWEFIGGWGWGAGSANATEMGLQMREDKTTYGWGLVLDCCHLMES